jgi:hypothetical protein
MLALVATVPNLHAECDVARYCGEMTSSRSSTPTSQASGLTAGRLCLAVSRRRPCGSPPNDGSARRCSPPRPTRPGTGRPEVRFARPTGTSDNNVQSRPGRVAESGRGPLARARVARESDDSPGLRVVAGTHRGGHENVSARRTPLADTALTPIASSCSRLTQTSFVPKRTPSSPQAGPSTGVPKGAFSERVAGRGIRRRTSGSRRRTPRSSRSPAAVRGAGRRPCRRR